MNRGVRVRGWNKRVETTRSWALPIIWIATCREWSHRWFSEDVEAEYRECHSNLCWHSSRENGSCVRMWRFHPPQSVRGIRLFIECGFRHLGASRDLL